MKNRESNIELLRLLAMAMVVIGHFCQYDIRTMDIHALVCGSPLSMLTKIWLGRMSGVAVNVFVLISGYFSIRLKAKSVLNFVYLILFWRLAVAALQYACGVNEASALFSPQALNPLNIWFVKAYLVLMVISPILNAFAEKVNQRELLKYIAGFYLVAFVSDFIIPIKFWGVFGGGYSAIWFVGLYLIGRYVRVYGLGRFDFSARKNLLVYVGASSLAAILLWSVYLITDVRLVVGRVGCFLGYYTSPFVVLGGLALFQCFSKITIRSRVINYLALSTFAIYLAHSPTKWFWPLAREMFNLGLGAWCLRVFALLVAIFVGTILVDQLRIYSWRGICAAYGRLIRK